MKVSKKKITFQKTDRILYDGTFITNGLVIWKPAKIMKEISFPDPAIFTKFSQGESFDWEDGKFSVLDLDLAKVFALVEGSGPIPVRTTRFRADYFDDPVEYRILIADGEIIPVNQVYLSIFDNLETYKVPGQEVIGVHNGTEFIAGIRNLSPVDEPWIADDLQEIAKENLQYRAGHDKEEEEEEDAAAEAE